MTFSARTFRTLVATPLATLLLTLSVAVPVMEVADLAQTPVVESEHEPGTCPPPHDHTVCTQVGANHAASGSSGVEHAIEGFAQMRMVPVVDGAPDARASRTRSARAPPAS